MKRLFYLLTLLTLLVVSLSVSQSTHQGGVASSTLLAPAEVVYAKSNYTTSTADTTSYIDVGKWGVYGFIIYSSDSAAFDVYFDAKNSVLSGVTTTYQDSLVSTSNTGGVTSFAARDFNTLRFPNENQVRFRVMARGSGQGTTSGRVVRIYAFHRAP